MSLHGVLIELAIVLGCAAVVTAAFQWLKLPIVLGYVIAGLAIGPHVPVPLVADPDLVHVLSELGVILLMFTIGLELPLASIKKLGKSAALTAACEVGLVIAMGTGVALLLGFATTTAIVAGSCLGISSTMLVVKTFDSLGLEGGFTELVYAILVFEDLIAMLLLAIVTAIAGGAKLTGGDLAVLVGKLAGFLAAMLIAGQLIVPRATRWIAKHTRKETLLVGSLFLCFGFAALASAAGFSVALGAFVAGVLIAESGHGAEVDTLVASFRDVFASVFFVSVGMTIDPAVLVGEIVPIAIFSAVVIAMKPMGVFAATRDRTTAKRAGISLAQIGEFSFVIATVLGDQRLMAIVVGVSIVTMTISPIVLRRLK